MKNKLFFVLASLFLAACSSSNEVEMGNKTSIEVQKEINMGNVQYGETIEAPIVVKNTGNYPLVIGEVKGSCSCTVAEYPKDPVLPGESVTLTAKITTSNASKGPLVKDVRIMANTNPSVTSVVIKANVQRK